MPERKDLTGQRFGRLTAIKVSKRCGASNHYRVFWLCRCDCGAKKDIVQDCLSGGTTRSCGCFKRDFPTKTHGKTGTPTHKIWCGMKKRCYQTESGVFYKYGGRGIRICDRWLGVNGFENFLADMGERPDGLTIERKDNNGNYEPGNCRWATAAEQASNKRNTVHVFGNETLAQCARRLGLNYKSLHGFHRMQGLSIEESIQRARPAVIQSHRQQFRAKNDKESV